MFGYGSEAVLFESKEEANIGILDCMRKGDGSGGKYLYMPGGGSLHPATHETVDKKMHYVHQDGRNVFKFAVKLISEVSAKILERNGYSAAEVTLYVPHQANLRIIQSSLKRLKLRPDQVAINIDQYANTTAATIPIGLAEAHRQGRIHKGDLVLLASFGAGFTWGSVLLRWGEI